MKFMLLVVRHQVGRLVGPRETDYFTVVSTHKEHF